MVAALKKKEKQPFENYALKFKKKKKSKIKICLVNVLRIHCPEEDFVSSLGGVVVFIFSALGNCVRRRASKSSRRSYSFPR